VGLAQAGVAVARSTRGALEVVERDKNRLLAYHDHGCDDMVVLDGGRTLLVVDILETQTAVVLMKVIHGFDQKGVPCCDRRVDQT